MGFKFRDNRSMIFQLPILVILASVTVFGQGLSFKLSQKADFIPPATSPKEQLIEVAQHYKVPMGIEWTYAPGQAVPLISVKAQPTVSAMIGNILQQAPGYLLEIKNGVVNIRSGLLSDNPYDFLNLRIPEYSVNKVNVFGAEYQVRLVIDRTLHPDRYVGGSIGGYAYPPDGTDGFEIKNISFSRRDTTVRELLNEIIKENDNALWVVELNPSKMMKNEPFFAQRSYGGDVQTHFAWKIIPFTRSK